MKKTGIISLICLLLAGLHACKKEMQDAVVYDASPYIIDKGQFPEPNIPLDNTPTVEGVKLGKMLFYENMLSEGNLQACADCHVQVDGFSDKRQFSLGVDNLEGSRQAMPIFNLAWHSNGFFWDGRAASIREQALKPIQDPLEMNEELDDVVEKLSESQMYRDQFIRAFNTDNINPELISLALEQFMLTLVSNTSKYDRVSAGQENFTPSEQRGFDLYFTEYNPFFPNESGADCAHCHGGLNFENDRFMNNGLDEDAEFTDIGREKVTNDPKDRAQFKVPSLRNAALTAPYMHDGRFNTLMEVIDHYNSGIKNSSTVDPALLATQSTGLYLSPQDKQDLLAFLNTLTDQTFIENPEFSSPF